MLSKGAPGMPIPNSSRTKPVVLNIIGAGSLGSFVAFHLAKMLRVLNCRLRVIDFDIVESRNVENQIYKTGDVGRFKVDVLKEMVFDTLHVDIETDDKRVDHRSADLFGVIVVLVDSMKSRKEIFNKCAYDVAIPYFIEARTGGDVAAIYAFNPRDKDWIEKYSNTLYSDDEVSDPVCARHDTVPTLWMVASVIGQILVRLKNQPIFYNEFVQCLINNTDKPTVNTEIYPGL